MEPQFFFSPQKPVGEDSRQKGRNGENDPHIGRHGICKRDVFQQIVQADSAQSSGSQRQLLFRGGSLYSPGADQEQRRRPQKESEQ